VTQEEDVDLITVYTDIYNMRIELEKMKKPIGTRDSPARSCKDLFHGHPQLKDGELTLMSPDKIRELLLRKDVYAVLQKELKNRLLVWFRPEFLCSKIYSN
jgi:hypothetical protein